MNDFEVMIYLEFDDDAIDKDSVVGAAKSLDCIGTLLYYSSIISLPLLVSHTLYRDSKTQVLSDRLHPR